MSYIITSPFPSFNDTDGSPLNNGYVYVGSANLNPVTDPIPVYWDEALTQPAAQPIRTINGYLSRNGSPGRIYTAFVTYSLRVTNNKGALVFSDLNYRDPSTNAGSTYQQVITAIAGQTVFNLSRTYIPGTNNLFVYRNGLRLIVGQDYNETGYSQITLTAGADNGDEFVFDIGYNYDTAANIDAQDVTYKLPAVDSVFTNVEEKLAETVSVKDFGAAGDGITDDTAAIQAALTEGAGGAVFFPEGIYLTSDALSVPANTTLYGTGVGSVIKSLTLTSGGSGFGHRQLDVNSVAGVRVSNLKFDAGSMTGFLTGMRCILCYDATDYMIQDCVFITPGAAVASVNGSRFSILNNDVLVQSTTGITYHDGIIDQWAGSNNFQIRGNRIRGAGIGKWGILATGQTTGSVAAAVYNYVISDNHVFDCTQAGIWAMGRNGLTYNLQITDNIVDTVTPYYGVAVTDAYNFVVKGNVLRNTGLCSIRVYAESPTWGTHAGKYGVISDNVCQNANTSGSTSVDGGSAISVTDASEYIEVVNNIVRGSTHRYAVHLGVGTSNIDVKGECYIAGVDGDILNQATLRSTNKLPGANLYQPTMTAVANISSANGYTDTMYKRSGNIVQVYGRMDLTPTAAGSTATQLGISLPIASNFTATSDASGTASTVFGITAGIYADTVNDRVILAFQSPNTTVNIFSFHFQYRVK